jgi:hypothetical protein
VTDLKRIADALEHLAFPQITHPETCSICRAKKKPIRKMPQSVVPDGPMLAKVEKEIRIRKMLAGPEMPVGDTFRYRELNKDNT